MAMRFDGLRTADCGLRTTDYGLRTADYGLVTEIVTPTRDGVLLRADLHQPTGDTRRPVLLVRTPYGRQQYREDSLVVRAVERDYAVVVQDVRGRYGSGGDFDPYKREGADGYDTVEWIASQPWCNGRVATAGLSYPGAVQWLAAVEAPPHLVCAFPAMCFSSGRQFFYFGGAFDMSWLPWTANNIAPDQRRRHNVPGAKTTREARAWFRQHGREALRRVPLRNPPSLEGVAPFYDEWLDHPDDGPYWEFANLERRYAQVRVPIFNFSGWHDEGYGPIGATTNYAGLRASAATAAARAPRLTIGPWVHGEPRPEARTVGELDFGPEAGLDYDLLVLDWCDLHVRGVDRGLGWQAPVRLFVMGANRWRDESTWPVPVTPHTLYLRAGGRLTPEMPAPAEAADGYLYDPNDPLEDPHYDDGLGPHDQRALESRRDVLVFSTPPLDEDVEIVGRIEFRLWVASSATDTDFFCRLLDVDRDGAVWNLMSPTLEVLRAKYRHDEARPELLTPGQPVELTLRLGLTAHRFLRGHRIRVHVTSSFFPHLDRNPNTGRSSAVEARLVPARQTVFHDEGRPSRVVLPVSTG
jgi:putative CocE/NonD family hydrolase